MKKKLEADLMSIAHRVLQMKNKSDINQLYVETQKLYEKLSVLRFVEEHFGGAKPTIGQAEIVEKMKQFFEENQFSEIKTLVSKEESVAEEEIIENVVEAESEEDTIEEAEIIPAAEADFNEIEPDEEGEKLVVEEKIIGNVVEADPEEDAIEEEVSGKEWPKVADSGFVPAFELDNEEEEIVVPKKIEAIQISFEELLGADYSDTLFVKADPKKELTSPIDFVIPKENVSEEKASIPEVVEPKTVAINDKHAVGISIGLNDRIGFVKHLFANSDEDYSRVMNQLITFDSFEEAQSFIEEMVKPDYNNWEGKEDYEQRFIEIIEKKFA